VHVTDLIAGWGPFSTNMRRAWGRVSPITNKDKVVLKVNCRKAPTLRLINPKHHVYYVISALDMTKLNHLAGL
jgi:hypothetical protein